MAIGGAYAALDGYEEMMHSRLTPLPPMVPRIGAETFYRWLGSALAKLATAIHRTAGSRAAVDGSRFERIYRDLSMLSSHRNTVLREWAFGEIAREHLGLPRRGAGNAQTPHGPK